MKLKNVPNNESKRKDSIIAFGRDWRGTVGLHTFIKSYPRRLRSLEGWNFCDSCKKYYRVWVTDDSIWNQLPDPTKKACLCTRCFRKLIPGEKP